MPKINISRTKNLAEAKKYARFKDLVFDPRDDICKNRDYMICDVARARTYNNYGWRLVIPMPIYEKLGKKRFTGEDILKLGSEY
jgi:hypothetical protein